MVVIDGYSNDKSSQFIQDQLIARKNYKVLIETDKGIYDAMNKGIGYSKGEIIFILNSDDIFYDNHVVEDVVNSFKDDIDIVYGNIICFEKEYPCF